MAGAAARRDAARVRLMTAFLAGLQGILRDVVALLDTETASEAQESAAAMLRAMSETAQSLGLSGISREAGRLSTRAMSSRQLVYGPLVREVRALSGTSPFAPLAFVGPARQLSSIASQDDGVCEPVRLFETVAELRSAFQVEWPQAIVLPADQASEVIGLASEYGCLLYLCGPSRDLAARKLCAKVGADGFVADPIALPEFRAHVRFAASRPSSAPCVALFGPPGWAESQVESLERTGLQVLCPGGIEMVSATLHGAYPDAVVLGPDPGVRESLAVLRQHVGRTHVALLAYGDATALGNTGVDDILTADDDLAVRVHARVDRFRDHRRDRDELTQALNRAGALEALHRMVARTERGAGPLAVALVHATGLADASDLYGREAGNACRRHLAAALDRGLRRVDLVGALGEETFLGVLVDCHDVDAERRLDEIRTTFEARIHADKRLREVVLHVGHANTSLGRRGLMQRAVLALDAARSVGRIS